MVTVHGLTLAAFLAMDILHRPYDSRMQRFLHPMDEVVVYAKRSDLEPVVTLTGAELATIVALHYAQAKAVLTLAQKAQVTDALARYPKRRLLGQHKALKMSPLAPHTPLA